MIYVLGLAAICAAWLLPGHYFPWTGFQQEALAAAGAVLVSLAAVVTVRLWPARIPVLAFAAAALASVPMIQWASGLVPYLSDALLPAAYLTAFGFAIVTGLQLTSANRNFVGALFSTFAVGAFVSTALAMAQWFGLGPYGFLEYKVAGDRVFANFTQPNHLASLIGLGAAGLLWAYETRRINGVVASVAIGFQAWAMVMTQSRVGWLCVIEVVLFVLLYRRRLSLRTKPVSLLAGSALFVAMVLAWGPINGFVQTGAATTELIVKLHDSYRLIHWQTVSDALLRSPWTGYGWLQIPRAQLQVVLEHPVTFEHLGSSHNQFLDLLLWNGLPIGLLAIAVVAWWSASRMRRCADVDSWALIVGLGVLFAHSMVEFPLQYAYFLLPAGFMIGAIEARQPPASALPRLCIGRTGYALVAITLAGLIGVVVKEYLDVEEQVRRVRFREMGGVEQRGYEAAVPNVVVLDAPREYVRMWLSRQHEGMSGDELDWLETVSERYPTPPALTRYALAAGLNGRAGDASRALQLLCHIQMPLHCDQARVQWATLTKRYPVLAAIPFPQTPPH